MLMLGGGDGMSEVYMLKRVFILLCSHLLQVLGLGLCLECIGCC